MEDNPKSKICGYNETSIYIRGKNLCEDLIGKQSFTEFAFYLILGEEPNEKQRSIVDACLVTIAEHGLSPSAIVSRMTLMGAPESLQGAVAAGLLGVGDVFVGTVETTAPLLQEIVASEDDYPETAKRIVNRLRAEKKTVPGFGQPHHKPDDPRPAAIFRVAEEAGASGDHTKALRALSEQVDEAMGRHITINAPGAISAAFLDVGIPPQIMRGFMLIARCAGLCAHLLEEQTSVKAGKTLWVASTAALPYEGVDLS